MESFTVDKQAYMYVRNSAHAHDISLALGRYFFTTIRCLDMPEFWLPVSKAISYTLDHPEKIKKQYRPCISQSRILLTASGVMEIQQACFWSLHESPVY